MPEANNPANEHHHQQQLPRAKLKKVPSSAWFPARLDRRVYTVQCTHIRLPLQQVSPPQNGFVDQFAATTTPTNDCTTTDLPHHHGRILPSGKKESRKSFFVQTFVPFVLAGCGMVAAGVLLDRASCWQFLSEVPEALILVPALLGLKGNLEMTMASRLSTIVNLGQLDSPQQELTALYSNIALDQAEAILVALFASVLAVSAYWLEGNQFHFSRAFCVVLSAITTASAASYIMASLMVETLFILPFKTLFILPFSSGVWVLLAVAARRCRLNPDNIATPLAAAAGDVISLSSLVMFGTWFYRMRDDQLLVLIILFTILISSVVFWMWVAARVKLTREVLKYGLFSVLTAVVISSGGGYVLRLTIGLFPGIGLFQPVINGVGGNLVAVQASKISTYLHQYGKKGILPANCLQIYANPLRTFACKERESYNALILLGMSVPGHLLFIGMLLLTGEVGAHSLNLPFMVLYLCAAILQIVLLLYCCQLLCRGLWRLHWNPDNNAIPLLTALGDLLGTSLLALAFFVNLRLFPQYASKEGHQMVNLSVVTTTFDPFGDGGKSTASDTIVELLLNSTWPSAR